MQSKYWRKYILQSMKKSLFIADCSRYIIDTKKGYDKNHETYKINAEYI